MKLGIFLCSLVTWKCLFNSFAYRLFAFILLFFGALYIFCIHPFVGHTLCTGISLPQEFFWPTEVVKTEVVCPLELALLVLCLKNLCLPQGYWRYSPVFHSANFIFLSFIFTGIDCCVWCEVGGQDAVFVLSLLTQLHSIISKNPSFSSLYQIVIFL